VHTRAPAVGFVGVRDCMEGLSPLNALEVIVRFVSAREIVNKAQQTGESTAPSCALLESLRSAMTVLHIEQLFVSCA
jgi:hypothetical protein